MGPVTRRPFVGGIFKLTGSGVNGKQWGTPKKKREKRGQVCKLRVHPLKGGGGENRRGRKNGGKGERGSKNFQEEGGVEKNLLSNGGSRRVLLAGKTEKFGSVSGGMTTAFGGGGNSLSEGIKKGRKTRKAHRGQCKGRT